MIEAIKIPVIGVIWDVQITNKAYYQAESIS